MPRLKKIDSSTPFVMIDVGAAEGIQPRWRQLLPALLAVGFEPDERTFGDLEKSRNITYRNVGVGRASGTQTIYLTKKPTCSSTFPPNRPFVDRYPNSSRYDVVQESAMPVQALDSAISDMSLPSVDFVKLDVHGAELGVLAGAQNAIQKGILGFEIELCMNPIWKGQPLFHHVMTAMVDLGYEFFDFRPYYWRRNSKNTGQVKGQATFGDALFLLSPEAVRDLVSQIGDREVARSKVLHAVQMFLLYGYKDCAEATFEFCAALFSADEQAEMRACWREKNALTGFVDFFLRRGIFKRLLDRLRERADPGGRLYYSMEPRLGGYTDFA